MSLLTVVYVCMSITCAAVWAAAALWRLVTRAELHGERWRDLYLQTLETLTTERITHEQERRRWTAYRG